ncbi:hypothetical protein HK102_008091 [Quaeritorhiza haematococci]|nr:hypothetical protein HK102_008091 [Quaeritorhiza haematococci]
MLEIIYDNVPNSRGSPFCPGGFNHRLRPCEHYYSYEPCESYNYGYDHYYDPIEHMLQRQLHLQQLEQQRQQRLQQERLQQLQRQRQRQLQLLQERLHRQQQQQQKRRAAQHRAWTDPDYDAGFQDVFFPEFWASPMNATRQERTPTPPSEILDFQVPNHVHRRKSQTCPPPTTKPSTTYTPIDSNTAARRIQRAFRNHKFRSTLASSSLKRSKIKTLNTITSDLSKLIQSQEPTALSCNLQFNTTPSESLPASTTGTVVPDRDARPFLAYEDALLRLLLKLDEVQSGGDEEVKVARKEAINAVEERLTKLDQYRSEQFRLWEQRQVAAEQELQEGQELESDGGKSDEEHELMEVSDEQKESDEHQEMVE